MCLIFDIDKPDLKLGQKIDLNQTLERVGFYTEYIGNTLCKHNLERLRPTPQKHLGGKL
ncbi:hypothetical protein VIBRN418_00646 [Vibrio sp. N418]|nr:hypothetical protein VIBRN418_00646 [Vibrio sp. N418]